MDIRRICVASTRAAYFGPGFELPPHTNDATLIGVGLHEDLSWRISPGPGEWTDWQRQAGTLIPSRTLHQFRTHGDVALLYLDPLSDAAEGLTVDQVVSGANGLRSVVRLNELTLRRAFEAMVIPQRIPRDEAVVAVIRAIDRDPDRFRTAAEAASMAALSPSWFRVKFAREVGLPFRRYRLWRRMALVMQALASGQSLTDAAQHAGFASSAHLSSSFRQMFGMAPRDLLRSGVSIDISDVVAPISEGHQA